MVDLNDMFRVGVITSPHGVRGEVNVFPTTDEIDRFSNLAEIWMVDKKEKKLCHIDSVKYSKNMVILKLREVPDRNAAELLRQRELYVDRKDAIELSEGEYFIADLIGLKVISDEGTELGELTDVLKTGANDVYVVEDKNGKEILLPVIEDCIKEVDLENKKITVHILKGLLD